MARRTGKSSGQALITAERRLKAVDLRKQGLTYRQIAAELKLGGGPNQAHKLVISALQETAALTAEETTSLRELEGERLDAIINAHWLDACIGPESSTAAKSAEIILKAIAMRAKIFGLEAPVKVSNPDGSPVALLDWASIAAAAQRLEEERNTIDVTPEQPAASALGDGEEH